MFLSCQGFSRIPNEIHTWPYHEVVGYAVMAACVGSFALACNTSPGIVRAAPAPAGAGTGDGAGGGDRGSGGRHAGLYPHDGVVFVEGVCKTCKIPK